MKLKKYIYTLFAFGLLGVFSACSDWLDYQPKDKETEDQTFSSKQGFYTAVNGVYNRLVEDALYGKNLTYGLIDLMGRRYATPSDLMYVADGVKDDFSASLISNHTYSDIDLSKAIQVIWEDMYAAILNINVILDNADKKLGTILVEKDYNLIKGDMLALRAFLHFDILRMFGPVYSRNPEQLSIPYNDSREAKVYDLLSAKSIIYDHIIPDLNTAEECLSQSDPIITDGPLASTIEGEDNYTRYRQLRMNYYATILLKARVYLWAGDKTNALIEARKLTDNEQVKEFFPFVDPDKLLGNSVDPDRTFSTEVLFGFYDSGRNTIYTSYFDAELSSSVLLQARNGYVTQLFNNNTADYRYQSQWTISGKSNSFVKYKALDLKKEDLENNIYPFYTYFMPLMHLSEAYYIVSECLLDTDVQEAINYMNTIMAARGRIALKDLSANDLLEEIKLEYMREMIGEGQVFYMLKRFFQPMSGVYNATNTSTKNPTDAIYVLPLPESELVNR